MYQFLKKFTILLVAIFCIWLLKAQSNNDPIDELYEQYDAAQNIVDKHPVEALQIISTLIIKLEKQTTPSVSAANLWHDIGRFYFDKIANYKIALTCFESALKIRAGILDPSHNDLARSYFMLGTTHKYLGNYEKAKTHIERAIKISEITSNYFMLANEYIELGRVYDYLGEYEECLNYYEKALPNILKSDRRRAYLLIEYYERVASIRLVKAQYYEALAFNNNAIRICKDSSNAELSENFNENIADCYTNMNISYRALNKTDSAYYCLQQAFLFFKKAQSPRLETQLGNVYLEMGNLFLHQNKLPQARQEHQKAIDILEKNNPHHSYLSGAYSGMGEDFLKEGKPEKALFYFEKALKVVIPNRPSAVKDVNIVTDKCLESMSGIARSEKALNQPQKAMLTFRQLDTLMSHLRSSLKEDGSKFSLAEQALPIYEQAIETALLLKDTLTALDFCERNKSVVLREALQDINAKQNLKIDPSVSAHEKTLKDRLNYYQKQYFDANDSLRGIWQDSIQRTKEALEVLIKKLEQSEPAYFQQKYAPIRSLPIAEIQNELPPEMLFLEYFMSDNQLFLFAISKNRVAVYPSVLASGFKDSINIFLKNIKNTAPDATALGRCATTSYTLYKALLEKPLADFNPDGHITRLRIVPDGILNYIPFDALIEQPTADLKRQDVAFVLKKYAVSYVYSNQLLKEPDQSKWSFFNKKAFGGFGIGYKNTPLSTLPFAESEVKQLQFKMGGDAFTQTNKSALKSVFLNKASNYSILHLSMHGTVDDKKPLKSALQFVNDKDGLDPVAVIDVNNLELSKNDLTVLSACNTGMGTLQRGEGILSLSRAFAQAGCKSLVMSLWSLQDAYTSEIITSFYDNLNKKQPKDIALAEAKRQFIAADQSERRAPNYWAALVVIGSLDEIDMGNKVSMGLFIVLACILIITVFMKGKIYVFLKRIGSKQV